MPIQIASACRWISASVPLRCRAYERSCVYVFSYICIFYCFIFLR
jgi:hypothetical protein